MVAVGFRLYYAGGLLKIAGNQIKFFEEIETVSFFRAGQASVSTESTTLSVARAEPSCTVAGSSRSLVIWSGGWNLESVDGNPPIPTLSNAVDIFDTDIGTIESTTMPFKGALLSMASVGSFLLVAGGVRRLSSVKIDDASIVASRSISQFALPCTDCESTHIGRLDLTNGEWTLISSELTSFSTSSSPFRVGLSTSLLPGLPKLAVGCFGERFCGVVTNNKRDGLRNGILDIWDSAVDEWHTDVVYKDLSGPFGLLVGGAGDKLVVAGRSLSTIQWTAPVPRPSRSVSAVLVLVLSILGVIAF